MKKINIGFIGCGRWAQQTYIPFFEENKYTNIVAVSGVSSDERGQKLVEKFNFENFYSDWNEMVEQSEVDLVVITTPHIFHYEQIKFCLEHGKHVQVDKPPVLHFDELEELQALSKQKKVLVNVHSQRRFYKEYQYAKQAIENGELGKIEFVQGNMGQQLFDDFKGSWRANPELAGGGIMFDSGYHLLDSILFMLGDVRTQSVQMMSNDGNHESDAYANLGITTDEGCVINLGAIRGLPKNVSVERIEIVGTEGWILISRNKREGNISLSIEHYSVNGEPIKSNFNEETSVDKLAPLENFIDAIVNGIKLESGLAESAESVKILEAGYSSVAENKIISF